MKKELTEEQEFQYELYPQVQELTYEDKNNDLSQISSYVLSENIDDATVNHLLGVVKTLDVKEDLDSMKAQVLVSVKGDDDSLEKYILENYPVSVDIFEEHDAYYINTENDAVIYAKDTDAAYHGITTLGQMLDQSPDSILEAVSIKDYSETAIRGFIEGFYGVPWSTEDRKELMRFGGDFKMNAYLFAPKDDPYHNEKWRVPYPEDKIAEITGMVEVGNETKNRFVWTIHPFMNNAVRFDDANYQNDLDTIIEKFEQLYDAGVRQFGVLADDVDMGSMNPNNQLRLMNDLHTWNESKKGTYSLIFTPSVYNNEWVPSNRDYFKVMNTLPEDMHVMWTGDEVMGTIEHGTVDRFQALMSGIDNNIAREPLFWLNWPVNDNNQNRLTIGKSEVLKAEVTNLDGVVTNPMQQAEASKGALFTIADYSWNTDSFDLDQNFDDSFKYIEETAYESLRTVAQHLNDQSPNQQETVYKESENIKEELESYLTSLTDETVTIKQTDSLIAEFQIISDATVGLMGNAENRRYIDEVEPWINSLNDVSESAIAYLEAQKSFMSGDLEGFKENYLLGEVLQEASTKHTVQNIDGIDEVEAGSKRLVPFITALDKLLSPPVVNFEVSNNFVDIDEEIEIKNLSDLNYDKLSWDFPGATIVEDSKENLVISYPKEGRYTISMFGKTDKGEGELIKENFITVSEIAEESPKDLALNKDTDVSSTCGPHEGGPQAVDGNLDSKWCADGPGDHYITIDLGVPSLITSITTHHAEAGGEPQSLNTQDYTLEFSNNGTDFETIEDVTNNIKAVTTDRFNALEARYVKLNITKPSQGVNDAARIFEVVVNGYEGSYELPPSYTE